MTQPAIKTEKGEMQEGLGRWRKWRFRLQRGPLKRAPLSLLLYCSSGYGWVLDDTFVRERETSLMGFSAKLLGGGGGEWQEEQF